MNIWVIAFTVKELKHLCEINYFSQECLFFNSPLTPEDHSQSQYFHDGDLASDPHLSVLHARSDPP